MMTGGEMKTRLRALPSTVAVVLVGLRLLACSAERPPAADYTPPQVERDGSTSPDMPSDDAGVDASSRDAADDDAAACPPVEEPTPAPPQGLCLPTSVWTGPTKLPFSLGGELLAAITPDERTLAVYRVSGPSGELSVFDRDDDGVSFAEPKLVEPGTPVRPSRAALSPDGLSLVLLGADWRSFVIMERASRTESFVPSDDASPAAAAFAKLNAEGAALGPDDAFDDPTFGADGKSFLYSVLPGGGRTLRISSKDAQGVWQVGSPLDDCELQSYGDGKSRRPSGLSADGRTLFYFDEVRNMARAAFRGAPTGLFTSFVDLGQRIAPQPNATCERLYSSRLEGGATDVVRESR